MIWLVAWLSTSLAQEAPAPTDGSDAGEVVNFDPMLIATVTVETGSGATAEDAARAEAGLRARFARSNTITPMADVTRFDAQGYDGVQYMQACPEGSYSGCALVLGQRAEVDWVVGATVSKFPDEFDENVLHDQLEVHFIDVLGGEVIATFDVVLDGAHDEAVIDGIARAYDKMVQGAYDARDMRDLSDPEQEEALRKERADAVAASLAALEEEQGDVVRGMIFRAGSAKVTKDQLDAYDTREERAPWERMGMTKGEYRRYANSGKDLKTWRLEKNGRFGQILGRAAVGGGSGPYSQRYVSQVLIDEFTLQPIHTVQLNEVARGGGPQFDLELGVGVAPWVEVMGVLGFRTGQVEVLVDEDKQNDVPIPGRPSTQALNTTQLGARVAFVPFNHSVVRPSAGLGIASWSGVSVDASERQDALPRPSAIYLEMIPGAEVSASPTINLFARSVISVPVSGTTAAYEETGSGMENPPRPASGVSLTGVAVQAGLTVRIGPFWKIDDRVVPLPDHDEEPP